MSIKVKLHGNIALGGGPKSVIFEKAFTVMDFPQLLKVDSATRRLRFAGDIPDALTEFGLPVEDKLCFFPS